MLGVGCVVAVVASVCVWLVCCHTAMQKDFSSMAPLWRHRYCVSLLKKLMGKLSVVTNVIVNVNVCTTMAEGQL